MIFGVLWVLAIKYSALSLLWLFVTAVTQVLSLARELLHAMGKAKKRKKKVICEGILEKTITLEPL